MQGDQQIGADIVEVQGRERFGGRKAFRRQQRVDAGRADDVDAPVLLAHLAQARGGGFGGGEMQVGQFGDGVAVALVDRALGHLAAVQVDQG